MMMSLTGDRGGIGERSRAASAHLAHAGLRRASVKSSCNCTALSRSREKAQIVTDYIIWERFYDSMSSGPALESGVLGRGAVLLSAYCNTVLRSG